MIYQTNWKFSLFGIYWLSISASLGTTLKVYVEIQACFLLENDLVLSLNKVEWNTDLFKLIEKYKTFNRSIISGHPYACSWHWTQSWSVLHSVGTEEMILAPGESVEVE